MQQKTRPMPFTIEQMKQVFDTNIIDFALGNGFKIDTQSKKNNRNAVHIKGNGGLYFFKNGRGYYCFSSQSKGNIIDFAKEYMGLNFKEAVEIILGCRAYEQTSHITHIKKEPQKKLILPAKDKKFNQVIAYLSKTRGIDIEIIYQMIKEGRLYQSRVEKNEKVYTNCAFVGFDENNEPKYCALRSHSNNYNFRQDVLDSDKTYGFMINGTSSRVYYFESPIDAMSHATLHKLNGLNYKKDYRLSGGGLSDKALEQFLKSHPKIMEIIFCYDNDMDGRLSDGTYHNHGQEMAIEMTNKYSNLGYNAVVQKPRTKDFNSDLVLFRESLEKNNISEQKGIER